MRGIKLSVIVIMLGLQCLAIYRGEGSKGSKKLSYSVLIFYHVCLGYVSLLASISLIEVFSVCLYAYTAYLDDMYGEVDHQYSIICLVSAVFSGVTRFDLWLVFYSGVLFLVLLCLHNIPLRGECFINGADVFGMTTLACLIGFSQMGFALFLACACGIITCLRADNTEAEASVRFLPYLYFSYLFTTALSACTL